MFGYLMARYYDGSIIDGALYIPDHILLHVQASQWSMYAQSNN